MFGLFRKKSKADVLRKKYKTLLEEAYQLSHTDRKASDMKRKEAEDLWLEVEKLEQNQA